METAPPPLTKTARLLGLAGLLPQLIAVLFLLDGSGMRWIATAGGYGYAALIFSFLGGLWWAIARLDLCRRHSPQPDCTWNIPALDMGMELAGAFSGGPEHLPAGIAAG